MTEENSAELQLSRLGRAAAPWNTTLQIFPEALRYAGTAMSVAASLFCSLLYAHLLMIVYMHENNFFSYDYLAQAGFASALMYLQFEIIALLLAIGVAGFFPFLVHTFFKWRRWKKDKEPSAEEWGSIRLRFVFGLLMAAANLGAVGLTLSKGSGSPFLYVTLGFAALVAVLITVIYCIDARIPRWIRLIGSFAFLGVATVMFPDDAANFVGQALQRAKLGGNVIVVMDYADSRGVSRQQLEAARTRFLARSGRKQEPKPSESDDVLFAGARAFECVAHAQGYLVLDAPEHLYVRVFEDECDAADSGARTGKSPLFVQVIEKSRLRHYRLYRAAAG